MSDGAMRGVMRLDWLVTRELLWRNEVGSRHARRLRLRLYGLSRSPAGRAGGERLSSAVGLADTSVWAPSVAPQRAGVDLQLR